MCGSVNEEPASQAENERKATAQMPSCVSATSETPISLPIISGNDRIEENRISAILVSFSSITAPNTNCPYSSTLM